jgi:hypothetical protein
MGHSYILWAPHGAIRFIHLTSFYVQQYFANTSEQLKQTLSFLVLPFPYILSHFTTVVLEQLTSKQYDKFFSSPVFLYFVSFYHSST